jgi:hypothetical protein
LRDGPPQARQQRGGSGQSPGDRNRNRVDQNKHLRLSLEKPDVGNVPTDAYEFERRSGPIS